MPRDNQFLWNRFCRLGEMIGDGLHLEPNGKWISKDYSRLSRILVPEIKEAEQKARKAKADNIQRQMEALMELKPCTQCGGKLIQRRKGTTVCYCSICGTRHKGKKK